MTIDRRERCNIAVLHGIGDPTCRTSSEPTPHAGEIDKAFNSVEHVVTLPP
jgi:hypothetical protein